MKFCAQPPPPSSTHDPAKGSHSYSTPFLVQLGVLPTSSTTTAATITTATRWKERGEEEKGGRIGRKGDGGRGIDMHLSSSVVASGCRKSRRRNLWKTRETWSRGIFVSKAEKSGGEKKGGNEARNWNYEGVFWEYRVDATDMGGDTIPGVVWFDRLLQEGGIDAHPMGRSSGLLFGILRVSRLKR